MGKSQGRHRAPHTKKRVPIAGAAGLAAAGAAVLGLTPTLQASPELTANVYYLPGTKIGQQRTEPQYKQFANAMIDGTGGTNGAGAPTAAATKYYVDYPGSFWPVTEPYFLSPTWNSSVATGVANLENTDDHPAPTTGDTIFGFSQGAVVASIYKADHADDSDAAGIRYVLVENPNRPNGGLLQRFNGLYIPILDVSFNGATEPSASHTIDIARQYDGWADFPTYPLNFLSTANAILGIVYVHGDTQDLIDPDLLVQVKGDGTHTDYYQDDTATTNTEYYLIPTERLPLLMPFTGIVPDEILNAADAPLRYLVELGYDRDDYSKPTTAGLFPALNPVEVATGFADAVSEGVAIGTGGATTSTTPTTLTNSQQRTGISALTENNPAAVTLDAPNFNAPTLKAPNLPDVLKSLKPPTRTPRWLPRPAADAEASGPADRVVTPRAIKKALKALAPKNASAEPGANRKKLSLDRHAAKRTADKAAPGKG